MLSGNTEESPHSQKVYITVQIGRLLPNALLTDEEKTVGVSVTGEALLTVSRKRTERRSRKRTNTRMFRASSTVL